MKKFLAKNKEALGGVIIIVIAFYCGRHSAPERTKIEIKTVEVEKVVTKAEHKTIKIKQNTDGSKETVIVVDTNTAEQSKGRSTTEQKEVVSRGKRTNVSILAGTTVPLTGPHYGISVQKELIGPFTFGIWGLTNSNVGISLGLSF